VLLAPADYTATSGTSIVLAEGAAASDIVTITVYDVFSVADTVSKSAGGTFDGNVAMAGTLGVTGAITGTLATAAQTNITSVGTLTSFRSTGIDDNADAVALTIDGGENVAIGVTSKNSSNNGSLTIGHTGMTKVTASANGNADELVLIGANASANVGMSMIGNNANQNIIYFGDEDDADIGGIIYDHNGNYMAFQTNTTEQVRIHSNGVLSASDGIALGVGTANTASNVLDDYEEGTWTPTTNNGTGYSAQFGRYVKIGKMVWLNANINTSSTSGIGNIIQGIPFASSNTGNSAGNVSIGYYAGVNTAMIWLSGYVLNGSHNIYVSGNSSNVSTIQHNGAAMFNGNSRIMFSVVYEAAA